MNRPPKDILWILRNENIYGHQKRFHFITQTIENWCEGNKVDKGDAHILDLGCGTGVMIAIPLAHLGFNVIGIDIDEGSIELANKINPYKNAKFIHTSIDKIDKQFDIIICSEVLEHLKSPEKLLVDIKSRLTPNGILIVTVPNGFGWFEFEEILWNKLKLGLILNVIMPKILKLKNLFYVECHINSSLSSSPHFQRFTYRKIIDILHENEYTVVNSTGSTLFAGKISDLFLSGIKPVMMLNNRLGDIFPTISSGFYIVAKNADKC